MSCEWEQIDCKFEGTTKCNSCLTDSLWYKPKEKKAFKGLAKRTQKADKRMGGQFEYKNHKNNTNLLKDDISSSMTLNSGATVLEKGDEQIRGLINIMEELKTKVTEQAPGKKTFTIQEKWLSKLKKEANAENMDFYYLKFSFNENDPQIYIIVEQEQIMSMVKTMVTDRREQKKLKLENEVVKAKVSVLQAEINKLNADIELLKKEKEQIKFNRRGDDDRYGIDY